MKIYMLMKCGYCKKKKVFTVNKIEASEGLMFCSTKCRNHFNKMVKLAHNPLEFYRVEESLTPKDFKIIKKENQLRLEYINNWIENKILKKEEEIYVR